MNKVHTMILLLRRIAITCCLLLITQTCAFSQLQENPKFNIIGDWYGEINVGATIQMIFKIRGPYTIVGTLDVPAQGAKDIPVDAEERPDIVRLHVPSINGRFEGSKVDSVTLQGFWKQNGGSFPMRLSKNDTVKTIQKRPQTPTLPLSYKSEDIIVQGPVGKLGGTITIPNGNGPFPAIILASGSGSQDRDETIFNHKPFFVLSDALTKAGFIVLRMDDRGVGLSEGNPEQATSNDFAKDYYAGIQYLKSRKEVNTKKIGIIGHSEGAMIGQIIASTYPKDIAFLCSMAGPGISGFDILVSQTRIISTKNMLPSAADKAVQQQKALLTMIIQAKDSASLRKDLIDSLGTWAVQQQKVFLVNTPEFKAQLKQLQSPWLRYFLQYNPQETLATIKCPILAINGSKDIQIVAEENLTAIQKAVKKSGNKLNESRKFEGLNHLFQKCNTCGIDEYMTIEQTIEPEVLDYIITWLKKL